MKKGNMKEGLVVGILILLVGAGAVSSTSGMNINLNNIETLILRPNAPGVYNQHHHDDGRPGNSLNFFKVDDWVTDEDLTYIHGMMVIFVQEQLHTPLKILLILSWRN